MKAALTTVGLAAALTGPAAVLAGEVCPKTAFGSNRVTCLIEIEQSDVHDGDHGHHHGHGHHGKHKHLEISRTMHTYTWSFLWNYVITDDCPNTSAHLATILPVLAPNHHLVNCRVEVKWSPDKSIAGHQSWDYQGHSHIDPLSLPTKMEWPLAASFKRPDHLSHSKELGIKHGPAKLGSLATLVIKDGHSVDFIHSWGSHSTHGLPGKQGLQGLSGHDDHDGHDDKGKKKKKNKNGHTHTEGLDHTRFDGHYNTKKLYSCWVMEKYHHVSHDVIIPDKQHGHHGGNDGHGGDDGGHEEPPAGRNTHAGGGFGGFGGGGGFPGFGGLGGWGGLFGKGKPKGDAGKPAPGPQAPGPQAPGPQAPGPQAPGPQANAQPSLESLKNHTFAAHPFHPPGWSHCEPLVPPPHLACDKDHKEEVHHKGCQGHGHGSSSCGHKKESSHKNCHGSSSCGHKQQDTHGCNFGVCSSSGHGGHGDHDGHGSHHGDHDDHDDHDSHDHHDDHDDHDHHNGDHDGDHSDHDGHHSDHDDHDDHDSHHGEHHDEHHDSRDNHDDHDDHDGHAGHDDHDGHVGESDGHRHEVCRIQPCRDDGCGGDDGGNSCSGGDDDDDESSDGSNDDCEDDCTEDDPEDSSDGSNDDCEDDCTADDPDDSSDGSDDNCEDDCDGHPE